MRFKYFLRGLGVGIIFASVICIVAFQSADSRKISDKEVIERAKELGMVEKQDSVKDMFATDKTKEKEKTTEHQTIDEQKNESTTKKKASEEKKTKNTTETKTSKEKSTEVATEKKTTEEKTTEATTEKKTTEEKTTEAMTEKKTTVTITIKGGMSSYPVCQMLQEQGLIKDASEFDNYLIKNGYANRISVGTHTLKIGMTYEEIAIAISDPQ